MQWEGIGCVAGILGSASLVLEHARIAELDACDTICANNLTTVFLSRRNGFLGSFVLYGNGTKSLKRNLLFESCNEGNRSHLSRLLYLPSCHYGICVGWDTPNIARSK